MFDLNVVRDHAMTTASNVFETMFYLSIGLPDGNGEGSPSGSVSFLRGEIEFRGQHAGKLCLDVPATLARAMAVNFLGLEEDEVQETHTLDVVGEVCNMICGNLFSQLDKKTATHLEPPQTLSLSFQATKEGIPDPAIRLELDAEGSRIQLAILFYP